MIIDSDTNLSILLTFWIVQIQKYSNKLSMKALVVKDILMKKQEKEMRKAPQLVMYVHLSRELKVFQGKRS